MTTMTVVINDVPAYMGGSDKVNPIAKKYGPKATVRQYKLGDDATAVPVGGASKVNSRAVDTIRAMDSFPDGAKKAAAVARNINAWGAAADALRVKPLSERQADEARARLETYWKRHDAQIADRLSPEAAERYFDSLGG